MDKKGRAANGGKKELQSDGSVSPWPECHRGLLWGAGQPLYVIWFHLESLIFLLISHIKDLAIQQSGEKRVGASGGVGATERVSHRAAETRQVNVLKTWPCPVKSAVLRCTDSGGYQRNAWAAGWQLENSRLLKDEVELWFEKKKKKWASQIVLRSGFKKKKERDLIWNGWLQLYHKRQSKRPSWCRAMEML